MLKLICLSRSRKKAKKLWESIPQGKNQTDWKRKIPRIQSPKSPQSYENLLNRCRREVTIDWVSGRGGLPWAISRREGVLIKVNGGGTDVSVSKMPSSGGEEGEEKVIIWRLSRAHDHAILRKAGEKKPKTVGRAV